MAKRKAKVLDYQRVRLDGMWYVIVKESVFNRLCEKADVPRRASGVSGASGPTVADTAYSPMATDCATLAEKLIRRRKGVSLSQAELARRAGVRVETLNRIERGKTTPDFKTIRKLAVALEAAEKQLVP